MDDSFNRFRSNNSIYNITEENNKFELYIFPDEKAGGVTYEKVRCEIERDLDISDITATDLQDDLIRPIIIEEYKKQVTKRSKDEQYLNILSIYTSSVIQDFESFVTRQIDLIEVDVKLVLDEYNSSFFTYESEPGIFSYREISEALFKIFNMNIHHLTAIISLDLMLLAEKLNWLLTVVL